MNTKRLTTLSLALTLAIPVAVLAAQGTQKSPIHTGMLRDCKDHAPKGCEKMSNGLALIEAKTTVKVAWSMGSKVQGELMALVDKEVTIEGGVAALPPKGEQTLVAKSVTLKK